MPVKTGNRQIYFNASKLLCFILLRKIQKDQQPSKTTNPPQVLVGTNKATKYQQENSSKTKGLFTNNVSGRRGGGGLENADNG